MWGIPTIQKLNNEAVEAAEIMKRKGYDLPEIKPAAIDPCVHTYTPLGQTPAERQACSTHGCDNAALDQGRGPSVCVKHDPGR